MYIIRKPGHCNTMRIIIKWIRFWVLARVRVVHVN